MSIHCYLELVLIGVILVQAAHSAAVDDDAVLNFKQFHTTFKQFAGSVFGSSDVQPMNEQDANTGFHYPKGFSKACISNPSMSHAGYRMVQNSRDAEDPTGGNPTMAILFDAKFQAAGMQSLVPTDTIFGWDCSTPAENYNYNYAKEMIEGVEYCVATIYFKDPSVICQDDVADHPSQLHLQRGGNFKPENVKAVPKTYRYLNFTSNFKIGHYFPGMGHNVEYQPWDDDDWYMSSCTKMVPFRFHYAQVDGECVNTGFAFKHWNTTVVDNRFGKDGHVWETLGSRVLVAIASDDDRYVRWCELYSAYRYMEKSMHVYLGGSTKYCFNKD